jgi:thiol-disulfide isomerase/thioredoxin
MLARLAALLIALTLTVSAAMAQGKAEPPKKVTKGEDRQAELDALIQDFVKARRDAKMAERTAKTAEEKKAAEAKMPKEADFLPRVHQLIANGAKDDVAGDVLAFAVFGLDTKDEKVFSALSLHFVKTEKIKRFVQMAMTGAPDNARSVLEKVLAENPSKELKGMACFALGSMAFDKEGDMAAKEAETYFARVNKEFADVPAGQGTLGEMAKGSLFELRNLKVGMPAPAAESKNLKGDKTTLADFRGKVVVLDIWATWCGPCKAMIPHEREMVEKFKTKPFALISVSADVQKKELEDFIAKEPMPWTHWWEGPDASLIKQWNVRYFPTIYVIDAKGVIRHKGIRGEELEKAVEKLLSETKP